MTAKTLDGIPVTDAKQPLTLHVIAKDCVAADPKQPQTCAAARAIKRGHKAVECRVHLGRVYIRQNKGNWTRYDTPASLRTEIISFDRGGAFEPGEYTLRPIRKSHRLGRRQGSTTKSGVNRKHKRSPPIWVKNVRGGPALGDQ